MNPRPEQGTSVMVIELPAPLGPVRVWVPEAVCSERGNSAVYPAGMAWQTTGKGLHQAVTVEQSNGPGNAPRVDPEHYECCGIRIPVDQPVSWETRVEPRHDGVELRITLRSEGRGTLVKAGAAVCVKYAQGSWWSDDRVYVRSGGAVKTLAMLGRDAGRPNAFQAYLMEGETYRHPFFEEFWGYNLHWLDRPMMVSRCDAAGLSVMVEAERAYMLHSNRSNPCTDIMLALGDVPPGGAAHCRAWVRVTKKEPAELLV